LDVQYFSYPFIEFLVIKNRKILSYYNNNNVIYIILNFRRGIPKNEKKR